MARPSPAPAGEAPPRLWIWVLGLATAVQALTTLSLLTLPAIAPEVSRRLDIPAAYAGYHISVAYAVATVTSLVFSGTAVHRWGACRTSQIGLLLAACGSLLSTVPSLPVMALGSCVIGLASGLPNPSAAHLLMRFTDARRRNLIFSIKQTGVPLGGVLAGLAAPSIALQFGWRWAPAAAAVAALAAAAALQPLRARLDDDRKPAAPFTASPAHGLGMVARERPLLWVAVTGALLGVLQLSFVTFLVTLLVAEAGFSLLAAGFVLAASQIAGVSARPVWGWLADRIADGPFVVGLLAAASAAAALVASAITPEWPQLATLALFVLLAATAMGWNGVLLAEVARLAPPGEAGTATGVNVAIFYVGALAGPSLFALAHGQIGRYTTTLGLFAGVAAAAAVTALLARAAERRAP